MSTGEPPKGTTTSVDKALQLCEVLSGSSTGLSVSEAGRLLRLPRPTVHRLLSVLKRRGFVRQDDDTSRYHLTLKVLDLGFRLLGRSELRLHAYPVLREYVLRSGARSFIAVPPAGEVTYIWTAGPDEVAMHTAYGKQMPGHCEMYFDATRAASRRLSCLRLVEPDDVRRSAEVVRRLGSPPTGTDARRLICTCAPVPDYTGQEVARVGLFAHGSDETPILGEYNHDAWDLARLVSMRLGYLAAGPAVSAGAVAD